MLDLFIDAILILAAVPNILILASVVVRGARVCRFDVGAQFKTLRSWRNTMVWGILVIPIICVMPFILLSYSNPGAWRLMEPTRLNRWSGFFDVGFLALFVLWVRTFFFVFSRKRWREAGRIIRRRVRAKGVRIDVAD